MEIDHLNIETEKITKGVWVAKCNVTEPIPAEVTMTGDTEQEAIDKLNKFLHS